MKQEFNNFETMENLYDFLDSDNYMTLTLQLCLENEFQDLAM